MSTFWHWYIIIITVGTLAATIWFLLWTSRCASRRPGKTTAPKPPDTCGTKTCAN